ncbi:Gag-Pol polyprotein, partial [Schistosoma japonicum]
RTYYVTHRIRSIIRKGITHVIWLTYCECLYVQNSETHVFSDTSIQRILLKNTLCFVTRACSFHLLEDTHLYIVEVDKWSFKSEGVCWYIPHHPVINPKKPEKLRIVFDCAAKYQDLSLNDQLLRGPNAANSLIGVLLRFRLRRIALAADIKEMFLQVIIPEGDREAFRLLWWKDDDTEQKIIEYCLTVHPFSAVSSPFCANFALRKTEDMFCEDTMEDIRRVTDSIHDAMTSAEQLGSILKKVAGEEECCRLILAKAGVAPLEIQTILRLELTAAVLAARIGSQLQTELNREFSDVVSWTDSMIVLNYIRNESSQFKTFVANRRYVPSKQNVADYVSRGIRFSEDDIKIWSEGPELKKSVGVHLVVGEHGMRQLISYYLDWKRLLKALAWLPRYKCYLLMIYCGRADITLRLSLLNVEEIDLACLDLIRFVQSRVFEKEVRMLQSTEGHVGSTQVMATVRERRIVGNRIHFRRKNARPAQQLMAPLSLVTVGDDEFPFLSVGVDYFGSLTVKQGRSFQKRYGCVFTCLRMRAIHLEVMTNLTTDSFIMADNIFSDNGTNLVIARRGIKNCLRDLKQDRIHEKLLVKGIDWHFRPPAASHWGGVWEHMNRS